MVAESFARIASKVGLKQLETLSSLEEARWFGRQLDDADAVELAAMLAAQPLPQLKYLKLFGNDLGAAGAAALVAALPSLPNVERVDLDNNASDDVEIIDATRMGTVRAGNHIGDAGAEALAAALTATPMPSLRALNMAGNSIGDRGAAALCALLSLTGLAEMNLLRNTFSVAAAQQLARAASGRKGVVLCAGLSGIDGDTEVASLVSADLSDPDGVLLAYSLWSRGPLPQVTELRLHDNLLGDAAAVALADGLAAGALPGLRVLTLNNNCVGDVGFGALVGQMQPGGALGMLHEIGLRQNLLTDGAMAALAGSLRQGSMPALRRLLLGGNALTDQGIVQLSAALTATRALEALSVLELQKNQIGDAGAKALAAAIQGGALQQLRELYFFFNALTSAGEAAIQSTGSPGLTRVVASLPSMFAAD
jgi:Ran GTPase-activating protein (RanGAP) involved in mRNA processing and transport